MKKKIKKSIHYEGKPAVITCEIEDVGGYISITGDITTARGQFLRGGCIHEDIAKYFPKIEPYLWLHLKDTTTFTPSHYIANTLYWLMNGEQKIVQEQLHLTDAELYEILAFVDNGLYKRWSSLYKHYTYDNSKNTEEVFAKGIEKYHIPERCKAAMEEFYKLVETL